MTRILGLDVGTRRIGVAVADPDGLATPLTTIRRAATVAADATTLVRLLEEQRATEIVVGLPFEAAGHEGSQAALTRAWVDGVAPLLGVPIGYRDERLTSHLAEQRLGPMKRGRGGGPPSRTQRDAWRARVDREAAAIILQDELDARAAAAPRPRAAAADPRDPDPSAHPDRAPLNPDTEATR
jgi:putative Holliday junction resolvase